MSKSKIISHLARALGWILCSTTGAWYCTGSSLAQDSDTQTLPRVNSDSFTIHFDNLASLNTEVAAIATKQAQQSGRIPLRFNVGSHSTVSYWMRDDDLEHIDEILSGLLEVLRAGFMVREASDDQAAQYDFSFFDRNLRSHHYHYNYFTLIEHNHDLVRDQTTRFSIDNSEISEVVREWNRHLRRQDIKVVVFTYRTGAERALTPAHLNRSVILDVTNGAGGYALAGYEVKVNFDGTMYPEVLDIVASNAISVGIDGAMTASNHIKHYLMILETTGAVAERWSSVNQDQIEGVARERKITFNNSGYAEYFTTGYYAAPRADDDTTRDVNFSSYVACSDDLQTDTGMCRMPELIIEGGNNVHIPMQDWPVFLLYDLQKIASLPEVTAIDDRYGTFSMRLSNEIFARKRTMLGGNNLLEWLKSKGDDIWNEIPLKVTIRSDTDAERTRLTLAVTRESPHIARLFTAVKGATTVPTLRTLYFDNADLRLITAKPGNLCLYGNSSDMSRVTSPGGTLHLSGGSRLLFGSGQLGFWLEQLILDRRSQIVFEKVALEQLIQSSRNYQAPLRIEKVTFYDPVPDAPVPRDITDLIEVKAGPVADRTIILRRNGVFLTHFRHLEAVDRRSSLGTTVDSGSVQGVAGAGNAVRSSSAPVEFFAESIDTWLPSGRDRVLRADRSGRASGFFLLQLDSINRLNVKFYNPIAFSSARLVLHEPLMFAEELKMLKEYRNRNNQHLSLSDNYAGRGFFEQQLTDEEAVSDAFVTLVRNNLHLYRIGNALNSAGQRVPLLRIVHQGREPTVVWTVNLTNFNLDDVDLPLPDTSSDPLAPLFSFTGGTETAGLTLRLGLSQGVIRTKVPVVRYIVEGPIFADARNALRDKLSGSALSSRYNADISLVTGRFYSDLGPRNGTDSYVLHAKLPPCTDPSTCSARKVSLIYRAVAPVVGVVAIDAGALDTLGNAPPLFEVVIAETTSVQSADLDSRGAILGPVEFASEFDFAGASPEARQNAFSMNIVTRPGIDNFAAGRSLFWILSDNFNNFLSYRYYVAGTTGNLTDNLVGTLEVQENTRLFLVSRNTFSTLRFAKIVLRPNGVLSFFSPRDGRTIYRLALAESTVGATELNRGADPTIGTIELKQNAEMHIPYNTTVWAGDVQVRLGGKIIFREDTPAGRSLETTSFGNLVIKGTLYLNDYTSIDLDTANRGNLRSWNLCTTLVENTHCGSFLRAKALNLNNQDMPRSTGSVIYHLPNFDLAKVTFNEAGDYPILFTGIRVHDLVIAPSTDWYEMDNGVLKIKARHDIRVAPNLSTYQMIFYPESITPIRSVPGFRDALFMYSAADWASIAPENVLKMREVFRGLSLRSAPLDFPNVFLNITSDYNHSSEQSLIFPHVPEGRLLTIEMTLSGTASRGIASHNLVLGGSSLFKAEYSDASIRKRLTVKLGGVLTGSPPGQVQPFSGRLDLEGLNSVTLVLATTDRSFLSRDDYNGFPSHRIVFDSRTESTAPVMIFTTQQSGEYFVSGNFALDFPHSVPHTVSFTGEGTISWISIDETKPIFHQVASAEPISNFKLEVRADTNFYLEQENTDLNISEIVVVEDTIRLISAATEFGNGPQVVNIGSEQSKGRVTLQAGATMVTDNLEVRAGFIQLEPRARLGISGDAAWMGHFSADEIRIDVAAFDGEVLDGMLMIPPEQLATIPANIWLTVAETPTLTLIGSGANIGDAVLVSNEDNPDYIIAKRFSRQAATGKYRFQMVKIPLDEARTFLSTKIRAGDNFNQPLVFFTLGSAETREIVFIAHPDNSDAESVWRVNNRYEPARTIDNAVSFWTFQDGTGTTMVPRNQQVLVKSGLHSLHHGGSFGLGSNFKIGGGSQLASLGFYALPEQIRPARTTYYYLGGAVTDATSSGSTNRAGDDATDTSVAGTGDGAADSGSTDGAGGNAATDGDTATEGNDLQLRIASRGEIIIGPAVKVLTASRLRMAEDAKIKYKGHKQLGRFYLGQLEVVRPENEVLRLPSLAVFELIGDVLDEQAAEDVRTIFKYRGGSLTFADGRDVLSIQGKSYELVQQGNEVQVWKVGASGLPETQFVEEGLEAVVGMLNSSLQSIASFDVATYNPTGTDARKQAVSAKLSGTNIPYYQDLTVEQGQIANAGKKYWLSGQYIFSGFFNEKVKSQYINSFLLEGGFRASQGFVSRLRLFYTRASIAATQLHHKFGLLVIKTNSYGAHFEGRITPSSVLGLVFGTRFALNQYRISIQEDVIKTENPGHHADGYVALEANSPISKNLHFTSQLRSTIAYHSVPTLGDTSATSEANWKNSYSAIGQLHFNHGNDYTKFNHTLALNLTGILSGDFFTTTPPSQYWIDGSLGLVSSATFQFGLSVKGFFQLNYRYTNQDLAYFGYQVGLGLQFFGN